MTGHRILRTVRSLLALLLLLPLSGAAAATDPAVAALDAMARDAIARKLAPAVALGVARQGKIVFARVYGTADLENGVAAKPESVFPIASVSKTFTSAAVLQLVQSGAIGLDDDIGKYLPDFPQRGKGVTVRRLLDHTAGVHNITSVASYWPQVGRQIEPAELAAFFRDLPLDFEPGTSYAYSNSGYILLGQIIEKASGLPYPEYLRTRLFTPLGMSRTSYCGGGALVPNRVRGYVPEGDGFVNARAVDMSQGYAAGGVCSTLGDLLTWQAALHGGKVLDAARYALLVTPHGTSPHGLGVANGVHGEHPVLFHYGSIDGFEAAAAEYPQDGLSIVVLANASGDAATELETRAAKAILQIADPAAQPLDDPARYAGTYRHKRGFAITLAAGDHGLTLQFPGGDPAPLTYLGDDAFAMAGSVDVLHVKQGTLRITHYGVTTIEAEKERLP